MRHLAEQNRLDLSILHGDGSNTVAKKGGDGIGYSGHKHQKGEKVIAIVENNGFVLAPLPVAPVNKADTVLLPDGLNALKRIARLADLEIDGSYLNRWWVRFQAQPQSDLQRGAYSQRQGEPAQSEDPEARAEAAVPCRDPFVTAMRGATFAWEDKFKRLLLRFEFKQQRHYGMKLMAYTLINLRPFCGA